MDRKKILLGDIGGTTVRFAVLAGGVVGPIAHRPVSNYHSMADAVANYLASCGNRDAGHGIAAAVLDVAGPVKSGRCVLVNSKWVIDADELRDAFGFKPVRLINDFEAVAYALPSLGAGDVETVGGGAPPPGESMAVLGPGTGLGMAGVVRRDGRITVVPTEGGHATLPTVTQGEDAAVAYLRRKFDHVSAERVLSGPGLENLYEAVAATTGARVPQRTAAQITELALDGGCRVAVATVEMFCALLGAVAGDLALMFRARGGVYIAGGIAPRIAAVLVRSEFRARFVAKGRFKTYLEDIPLSIIVNPDSAFLGLKSLAAELS